MNVPLHRPVVQAANEPVEARRDGNQGQHESHHTQALAGGLIDRMILDLNSAFFMRDAQLEDWDTPEPEATIVGQSAVSAQEDKMGMVMEKGSPLVACVNEAIAAVIESGQLQEIYDREIASAQDIPTFE